MALQLLLIETKDLHQSKSLLSNLESQGYQVAVAHNLEAAAKETNALWPNLIVFGAAQPHLNSAHLEQFLNTIDLNIPCIFVSQDNLPAIVGTEVVMIASTQPQQLVEGIKKAISRQKDRFIRFSNLIIDCQQRQVLRNHQRYSLTPKELKLLQLLIDNHNQVLSRKEIMQTVWETDYMGDTRTLDVHIRWVREKIEENPSRPQRLITVRGRGYRFIVDPD